MYYYLRTVTLELYSEITNRFLAYPFSLRYLKYLMTIIRFSAFDDVKRARLGICECIKHGVIEPLPVVCEKDGISISFSSMF